MVHDEDMGSRVTMQYYYGCPYNATAVAIGRWRASRVWYFSDQEVGHVKVNNISRRTMIPEFCFALLLAARFFQPHAEIQTPKKGATGCPRRKRHVSYCIRSMSIACCPRVVLDLKQGNVATARGARSFGCEFRR